MVLRRNVTFVFHGFQCLSERLDRLFHVVGVVYCRCRTTRPGENVDAVTGRLRRNDVLPASTLPLSSRRCLSARLFSYEQLASNWDKALEQLQRDIGV